MARVLMCVLLISSFLFGYVSAQVDPYAEAVDKCSMPSFVTLLPLQYRREFRKIWFSGPRTSAGCQSRHKQTEELVSMLPDELREKVILATVTTTESPSETSFLRGLSAENIHEFTSIMSERSLPVRERSRRLREWAVDLLDLDAAERFERYVQFLEERGDRYKEKLRRLSPQAVSTHNRLQALREERQRILLNLPESVKVELIQLWREKCPGGSSTDGEILSTEEFDLACVPESESITAAATTTPKPTTKPVISTTRMNRRRPWTSGVPQLETDAWQLLQDPQAISRLLFTLFSGDKKENN